MKKPLIILLGLMIVITVLFMFVDVDSYMGRIPLIKELYSNTSLEIVSTNSVSQIYINGHDHGVTNQTVRNLPAGKYDVKLVRVTEQEDSFYEPFEFTVDLEKNSEAFANIEIGPNKLTSGYIMYYTSNRALSDNSGHISIFSNVSNPYILVNDEYLGDNIQSKALSSGNYSIKIEKDGYESIKIPATKIVEKKSLNLFVYLFPNPSQ